MAALARSFVWCRDLITTPAEDMGPQHLAAEAQALAATHGSAFRLLEGDQLLEENYPAIHIVGRASYRCAARRGVTPPFEVRFRVCVLGTYEPGLPHLLSYSRSLRRGSVATG